MRVTQSSLINRTEIYVQKILKKNRENVFITCRSRTIDKQGGGGGSPGARHTQEMGSENSCL